MAYRGFPLGQNWGRALLFLSTLIYLLHQTLPWHSGLTKLSEASGDSPETG